MLLRGPAKKRIGHIAFSVGTRDNGCAAFKNREDLVVDGMVGPQTLNAFAVDWSAKSAPTGTYNDK